MKKTSHQVTVKKKLKKHPINLNQRHQRINEMKMIPQIKMKKTQKVNYKEGSPNQIQRKINTKTKMMKIQVTAKTTTKVSIRKQLPKSMSIKISE